jgi:hypothetical protein
MAGPHHEVQALFLGLGNAALARIVRRRKFPPCLHVAKFPSGFKFSGQKIEENWNSSNESSLNLLK